MKNEIIYNKIYARLIEVKNILIISHEHPDGDTLGCASALMEFLFENNKSFTAYCKDIVPENFFYLPQTEKITADKAAVKFSEFDAIIALDCGDLKRTGLYEEIKTRNKSQTFINIDHHPKVDDHADLEIKNAKAASTTELIYEFFKANEIEINKKIATAILTGISVDTGNFIFPATSDKAIKISSEMVAAGARLPLIIEKTWKNKTLDGLKIWGLAMSRLEINHKYSLAYTYLKNEEIKNIDPEELEGLSNFLGNIKEIKGVMLLIQKDGGMIKGSLRSSHPTADISKLARVLGGGGHSKASGFALEGKIIELEDKIRIN